MGKTSVLLRYLRNQFSPLYVPTKKVAIGKSNSLTAAVAQWLEHLPHERDVIKCYHMLPCLALGT